mmetsp:Transcript_29232/g.52234  ORF Transcript_29232/g.52234 Transcript_29232/m.52234 type:complete len:183 (-) Transcript_29232:27-575(-)
MPDENLFREDSVDSEDSIAEPPLPEKVVVPTRAQKPSLPTLDFTRLRQGSLMQTEGLREPKLTGAELKLTNEIEQMRRRLHEVSCSSEKLTEDLLTVSTKNSKLVAENQHLAATLIALNSKIAKAEELLKNSAPKEKVPPVRESTDSIVINHNAQVEIGEDESFEIGEIGVNSQQLYGEDEE